MLNEYYGRNNKTEIKEYENMIEMDKIISSATSKYFKTKYQEDNSNLQRNWQKYTQSMLKVCLLLNKIFYIAIFILEYW